LNPLTENPKKIHHPRARIPTPSLSFEEIFQFINDNPGNFPHQTKAMEEDFFEVFFHFFVEYFYMQDNIALKDFMNSLERAILVKILERFNGNQRDTAKFLRVKHTTLNQKVRKHKINFSKTPIGV
jgi:DNA-binding NtrC family response regulator